MTKHYKPLEFYVIHVDDTSSRLISLDTIFDTPTSTPWTKHLIGDNIWLCERSISYAPRTDDMPESLHYHIAIRQSLGIRISGISMVVPPSPASRYWVMDGKVVDNTSQTLRKRFIPTKNTPCGQCDMCGNCCELSTMVVCCHCRLKACSSCENRSIENWSCPRCRPPPLLNPTPSPCLSLDCNIPEHAHAC